MPPKPTLSFNSRYQEQHSMTSVLDHQIKDILLYRITNFAPTSHLTSALWKFLPTRLFCQPPPTPITSQLHISARNSKAQSIFHQSSITPVWSIGVASDLSVPRLPGLTFTADEEIINGESNGLYLELAPFGLKHIYNYKPNSYYPVHLGGVYSNNGQYRVIYKLGSGGFATIWLYRDTEAKGATKYVALKILIAETSSNNCPELRVN
jgi:hypothetical protein